MIYLANHHKILISSEDGHIYSIENAESGDIYKLIPSQTEQDFINYGMSEINILRKGTEKHYINRSSLPLEDGKVFEQTIDLSKYDIKRVKIK